MKHWLIRRVQDNNENDYSLGVTILASLLIALSGGILFLDKVITIELTNNFGFRTSQAFVWTTCQSISPLILIIGTFLKPFRFSYAIPVYFYSIQLIWVFDSNLYVDDSLLHIYAIGCVFAFLLLLFLIHKIAELQKQKVKSRETFLEKAFDLSVEINKRLE